MNMDMTFNSPLECGLRALVLLEASGPDRACDLQRLVFFDYLLVHSGDVTDGPPSVHLATPLRSGEALVRRHWVERGLLLMLSRELVLRRFSDAGIDYAASEITTAFITYLEQPYTRSLRERAQWVVKEFGAFSEIELVDFFKQNLDRWGVELIFREHPEEEV